MLKIFLHLFLVSLSLVYSLEACERYQLIDLGLLDYQMSEATSINDRGQVCGRFKEKNRSYIFIWDPSQSKLNYSKISSSVFPLINNESKIFGCQFLQLTNGIWDYEQEVIFCWKNPLSFFTFLNISGLGFPKEAAKESAFDDKRTVLWDINDHDELVIMNTDSLKNFFLDSPVGFKYQVWVYHQGEYTQITHPQFCVGFSLNNQSDVLGCYYQEKEASHKKQLIGNSIYNIKTKEVRILSFPTNAVGRAINDQGQIIGIFHHPLTHTLQGFVSDADGYFMILDHFLPLKNNNKNLMVGKYLEKPAIWDNGQVYDLLEVTDLVDNQGHVWDSLDELIDLNDTGEIIGQGKIQGSSHGFLLRPIEETITSSTYQ